MTTPNLFIGLASRSFITPFLLLCLGMLSGINCMAQTKMNMPKHKGFYLSLQPGVSFGDLKNIPSMGPPTRVSGSGPALDIQVGGAVQQNLILHAVASGKAISGPVIYDGYTTATYHDPFTESFFGGGATYYLPMNIFLTGNAGQGHFLLYSPSHQSSYRTSNGFSFQFKVGKEWWISSRWGLGAGFEYSRTSAIYHETGYEENWRSSRYSFRLTATLNGKHK